MKIWTKRIPEEGFHYDTIVPGEILALEEDPNCKIESDIHCELYAQHVSEKLIVRGTLSVELNLKCTRCTQFFSTTVVDSDFLRAYFASEEMDCIDISEDLREDLLLHIPGFPVCSKKCKGLCTQCGIDLNKETCKCDTEDRPNPWLALDNLDL